MKTCCRILIDTVMNRIHIWRIRKKYVAGSEMATCQAYLTWIGGINAEYIYLGCQEDIWYMQDMWVMYRRSAKYMLHMLHVWMPSAIEAGARYEWPGLLFSSVQQLLSIFAFPSWVCLFRRHDSAQWPIHCTNFHVQEEIKEEQVLSYWNRDFK